MITYDQYLNGLKPHKIVGEIAGKSEEEISEYEAKMLNDKTARLNIIGHIFVVVFVIIAVVASLYCLIKAFGVDVNPVQTIVKKAVDK